MDPEDYKTIKLTPANPHTRLDSRGNFAGEMSVGWENRAIGSRHEEGYGQIFIR